MKILFTELAGHFLKCALLALIFRTSAAEKTWTGAGGDMLWSTAGNWSAAGVPGPADNVTFGSQGATDTPLTFGGAVISIVDSAFSSSLNSLGFRNIEGVHNLNLMNPLVVQGASSTDVAFIADDGQPAIMFVGSGTADGAGDTVYTSIIGDSLTVSNVNANLSVMQGSETSGDHWATLDLGGLNFFTCVVSNILVAHDFGDPVMRPNGTLILAVSNSITANMISLSDAFMNAGSGGAGSRIFLGQGNTVNVGRIRIGLHKCVGTLSFTEGLSGASVTFRNAAGTGRQISWEIGDEYEPNTSLGYFTSNQAIGVLDLTGGKVDALVDRITLGRGQTNAPARTGDGNGTLTFGGGSINANSLEVGIQLSGGGSAGRGILNINNDDGVNPATLTVNSNLVMAVQLPGNREATGSTAEININGGILAVAGDIVDGGGNSTININTGGLVDLKPPNDATAGNISVRILNLNDGTLANYDTLSVSNINLSGSLTQFAVNPGQTISPIATGTIGTLTVGGDLILRGTVEMDIRKTGNVRTFDKIVSPGTIDLGGTLKVNLSGNGTLTVGDKFTLFSAPTLANAFTTLDLPSAGPGLGWTNKTSVNGSIEVVASGEPTTRPTLAITRSATSMTLSWPLDYTSFALRGQTNPVTVGVGNNWGTVPGVVGNQITIPIDPANGVVVFQLFQP